MKIITIIILLSFLASQGFASTYDAECLNSTGKYSDCKVTINDDHLKLDYKSTKEQDLNLDIPAKKIKAISAGEYARRRVAESVAGAVLFSPVALFALFSKKKMDQIGVEYTDNNNHGKATMMQVKKKYGFALKTELASLTGKEFKEETTAKK